jgi:hypothetical protein
MAGLLNGVTGAARATPVARFWSGHGRGRPRLGVGARLGAELVRRAVEPHHAPGLAVGHSKRGLRGIERPAGMNNAADRTGTVMGAMRAAALVGLASGISAAGTDRSRMQGIGGGDAGRKTCADRRKDLHRQRQQDDWKKISQAPSHQTHFLDVTNLIICRVRSRDQVPNDFSRGWMR